MQIKILLNLCFAKLKKIRGRYKEEESTVYAPQNGSDRHFGKHDHHQKLAAATTFSSS